MSNDEIAGTFYANGRAHAEIETVQRAQAVKRWHMIDTTRPQTLAEHSANVALLAYCIACNCPDIYFGSGDYIASAALRHDLAEVFTGDFPSHSKKFLAGIEELEQQTLPMIFQTDADLNGHQKLLIKICDLADGMRFIRLHGVDITAQHAEAGLNVQFIHKITLASTLWPQPVLQHVVDTAKFYAYTK